MKSFSFRDRSKILDQLSSQTYDLLVVGAGITGAAVARDAASRGLSVLVVDQGDIGTGTSSRSSKLAHGGLRYLEQFEFRLVFEALRERGLLLKQLPHLVQPLEFYFPIYRQNPHSRLKIAVGLWLYDLLSQFQLPRHRYWSRKKIHTLMPDLNTRNLKGVFSYFDASMWDDVITVEALRDAAHYGAHCLPYVKATKPIRDGEQVVGFRLEDCDPYSKANAGSLMVNARQVLSCVGPWTDEFGVAVDPHWRPRLNPSQGTHLVFPWKRIPVPGALIMPHPSDGRIVFVMPRKEFGEGVTIVGTTDQAPVGGPGSEGIDPEEVSYLFKLLKLYFPHSQLGESDVLSAYVGTRPLVKDEGGDLQSVSREHVIETGAGGVTYVTGGKYTTHRSMAEEIVEFVLEKDARLKSKSNPSRSTEPYICTNTHLEPSLSEWSKEFDPNQNSDLPGFPQLIARLKMEVDHGMVMTLEDFMIRRSSLFLARKDHGRPVMDALVRHFCEFRGLSGRESEVKARVDSVFKDRDAWRS